MSETDNIALGNHVVPTEWAQQLERERDEAREGLEEETKFHHRTHLELVETQCKLLDLNKERDEAREALTSQELVIAQHKVIKDLIIEIARWKALASA